MYKFSRLIILFLALVLALNPLSTFAITLDHFNKPTAPDSLQVAQALNPPISDVNVRNSDTAIGGTRTLKVDVTQGIHQGLGMNARVSGQTPGLLSHSQDSGVKGITTITWDGDSDPNSLDADGLGGVDFTEDGGTEIRIKVLEDADVGNGSLVRFTMVVFDAAGPGGDRFSILTKELTVNIPVGQEEILSFPFANFQQGGTAVGPANFENVGAVRLFIDGSQSTGVDLNIGAVLTNGECEHVPVNGNVLDDCGVCNGTNEDKGCDGVCYSGKTIDQCGVCDGGNSNIGCDGACFSTAVIDQCGVCNGNNSCLDCAGTPNGTAVKDACGVCGGDGRSCISCESKDVRPLSFVLDAGAKDQERLIKSVLTRLVKFAPTDANKAYAAKTLKIAHDLQIRNWNLSWALPPIEKQCSPAELCITASNQPIIDEYRVNSEKLRKLSKHALGKLKRVEKGLAPYQKKMSKRSDQFHGINMKNADKVPVTFQTSCG